MEEINVTLLNEEDLEEVAGGAGSSKKHAEIVNIKRRISVRSTPDAESEKNKLGYAWLGDRYIFLGWCDDWAEIYFGGRKGYLPASVVKLV